MPSKLGIIVALPTEATVFTQQKLTQHIPIPLSDTVTLIMSGMGSDNAEQAGQLLITQGISNIVSFGTAAGISPDCMAGDLIIADSTIDKNGKLIPVDINWQKEIVSKLIQVKILNVISAAICESASVVAKPADKLKLFKNCKASAVDMETITLARISATHHIPFVSLRAVVDPADMTIPSVVMNNLDNNGNVKITKLLFGLVKKPSDILPLIQLAKNFNKAKTSMKVCIESLGIEFLLS